MNLQKLILLSIPPLMLASCSGSDNEPAIPQREAVITLVTSYYGSGDMGYNDLILDGVCRAADASGSTLSIFRPGSEEMLKDFVAEWIETPCRETRILLFSSADQAGLLASMTEPDARHCVMTVDGQDAPGIPSWCRSIDIDRYGAAYLAGCIAAENGNPLIVAARPDDPVLTPAIEGFSDGYASINSGALPDIEYLAADESGFSSATEAFRIMGEINPYSFIFPLAGGSCSGIYKYMRENPFTTLLACGMDVDCAGIAPGLPFSMTIAVDKAIEKTILALLREADSSPEEIYCLATGYTDIVVDPDFYDNLITWEDYYDSPDYWTRRRADYLQEAVEAERRHRND